MQEKLRVQDPMLWRAFTIHLPHTRKYTNKRSAELKKKYLEVLMKDKSSVIGRSLWKKTVISPNFLEWKFWERHSFRIISGDSPETMRKLLFHKIFTAGNWVKLRYFSQCIGPQNNKIQLSDELQLSGLPFGFKVMKMKDKSLQFTYL